MHVSRETIHLISVFDSLLLFTSSQYPTKDWHCQGNRALRLSQSAFTVTVPDTVTDTQHWPKFAAGMAQSLPGATSLSSAQCQRIRSELSEQFSLHLTQQGVNTVCKEIQAANTHGTIDTERVYAHALQRSLQGIGERILPDGPPSATPMTLGRDSLLEVISARNITTPLTHQDSYAAASMSHRSGDNSADRHSKGSRGGGVPRLLCIDLSDGIRSMPALEVGPLPHLSLSSLVPGSKLLLRASTAMECGVLVLDRECVPNTIVGRVSNLAQSHALKLATDKARQGAVVTLGRMVEGEEENMSGPAAMTSNTQLLLPKGERPPPVFRPYEDRGKARKEAERELREMMMTAQQQQSMMDTAEKGEIRRQQPTTLMQLMPPPPIEETASGRAHQQLTQPSSSHNQQQQQKQQQQKQPQRLGKRDKVTVAVSVEAESSTSASNLKSSNVTTRSDGRVESSQAELEQEFKKAEQERADAAAARAGAAAKSSSTVKTTPSRSSSTSTRHANKASTPSAPLLSSFRTLLTTPLGRIQPFHCCISDIQLYPPSAHFNTFTMQLTLLDSFGMKVVAQASQEVFERFFGQLAEFGSRMATASGQKSIQIQLIKCRQLLMAPHTTTGGGVSAASGPPRWWSIEIEARASPSTPGARIFIASNINHPINVQQQQQLQQQQQQPQHSHSTTATSGVGGTSTSAQPAPNASDVDLEELEE